MIGVEAAGRGIDSGEHAARFADPDQGRVGVLHGTRSYVLQDDAGQILTTHSISAGLDYPAVGPEHSYLREGYPFQFIRCDLNVFGIQRCCFGLLFQFYIDKHLVGKGKQKIAFLNYKKKLTNCQKRIA